MVIYIYQCTACGEVEEKSYGMGHAAKSPRCKSCGKPMYRYYAGEQQVAITDPEITTADIDRNIAEVHSKKQVGSRVLSQSLADVPGARTIRGHDGRRYAMFRNKQDRRETCAKMGLPD